MIPQSKSVGVSSLMAAIALNIGVLSMIYSEERVEIAGSGAQDIALQGNAFADMATGTMTTPKQIQPSRNVVSETPPPKDQLSPQSKPLSSLSVKELASDALDNAQAAAIEKISTLATTASLAPLSPENVAKAMAPLKKSVASEIKPAPAQTVTAPPKQKPPQPPKRVDDETPKKTSVKATQPVVKQTQGNATKVARQGSNATRLKGTATQLGSNAQTNQTTAVTNAAISNYPGIVMRKISKVRRPRTNVRGSVVVQFSVAKSGDLETILVSGSSGNRDLDQLALRIVRRAAPFPAPPIGARTRFRVEVSGR